MSTTPFHSLLTQARDTSAELVTELTPQTINRKRASSLEQQTTTLIAELGQGIFDETDKISAFFALTKALDLAPDDRRLVSEIHTNITTCRARGNGEVLIPFADAHDHTVTWNMSTNHHMLVAGRAGYGKTELLRTLSSELSKRQIPVFGIEGFPFGALSSFRTITHSPEGTSRAVALIHALWKEMNARYAAITDAGENPAAAAKICVLIDAFDWFAHDVEYSETEPLRKFGSLLSKGGRAGLHFVYTVERPLGVEFSNSVRSARIYLGPHDPCASEVMWGDKVPTFSMSAGAGKGLARLEHDSPIPITTHLTTTEVEHHAKPQVYSAELQDYLDSAFAHAG